MSDIVTELKGIAELPMYASSAHVVQACRKAIAEIEQLRADKARLDFLDEANRHLNAYSGTTYRWEMVMNHLINRLMLGHLAVDLNDQKAHGLHSCRDAIDEQMRRVQRDRKTS